MTPLVRRATAEDLAAVVALEEASFAVPWSEAALLPELEADPRRHPLLALIDDQPVGFALVWVVVDEMHLVNLAVDPQWRRTGIGRALVTAMLEVAHELRLDRVTLEVRDSNAAARRLYREFGFRDVAVRPRYYPDTREDALIMLLELGQPGPG